MSGTTFLPRTPKHLPAPKRQLIQPFQVGDPLTVPAFSFRLVGGGHYQTDITCRLVGTHCYIFVENDMWGTDRVTQSGIESLARAFDNATNRDPDRGIFTVDIDLFGPPPNVDGDPRILIVILDVLDSPITGTTFVGYFDVENQSPPISREIIYLDSNPLDIHTDLARATLAHEFQHLLHWAADPDEDKWLDEGCSEYAELACGYRDTTEAATEDFLTLATNTGLTEWEDLPFDFDQAFLWMTYFAQRYGDASLRQLVADPENGIASVNNLLTTLNVPERFEHLHGAWTAALYLDGPDNLGLKRLDLGPVKQDSFAVPTTQISRNVTLWGTDFLTFGDAPGLSIDIGSTGNENLLVTLITKGDNPSAAPLAISSGTRKRIHTFTTGTHALSVTGTSGGLQSFSFSVTALEGTSPTASDFDANGEIGFSDFLRFAENFNRSAGLPNFDPTFDLDGDHKVGFSDFLIFAGNFGKTP
ncbi:MAG: hypothetical protein O7G87_22470 [bacterium]|nr:hypothetical protein [bacterium]